MSNKRPLRSVLLSLAAVVALTACDHEEVGPQQRFEVVIDEPTLIQLAELAEVDLEFDDYLVYSLPLVPGDQDDADGCGACIEAQNEMLCIDASCTVGLEPVWCSNGTRAGETWEEDAGVNQCWCTLQGEFMCTAVEPDHFGRTEN